jgi:hypothetical protein
MTPQEKAKELVDKFEPFCYSDPRIQVTDYDCAKHCALISVDEILKSNPCSEGSDRGGNFMWVDDTYYWEQVKHEINNL